MITGLNAKIIVQSRCRMTEVIILQIANDVCLEYVKPALDLLPTMALSHDLWMSCGNQDIFLVLAHIIDLDGKKNCIHIAMVQMDSTTGEVIAETLKEVVEEHGLGDKIIAYICDGGANLKKMNQFLSCHVKCNYLDIKKPFESTCWAHVLSNTIKHVFQAEDDDLKTFHFKAVKTRMQAAITWTKKSGKGANAWKAACQKANTVYRKLYTPVKTRFGLVVVMLHMLTEYKEAVHICYSKNKDYSLHKCKPTLLEWKLASKVVTLLDPLMNCCLKNQLGGRWALSDALMSCIKVLQDFNTIYSSYNGVLENTMEDGKTFEDELTLYLTRMCKKVILHLKKHLSFFWEYDESQKHYVFSLMLDPQYC